jgi:AraC-like DNA-binding protein
MTDHPSLTIKNMVCPRCVSTVKTILEDLAIPYDSVELGKIILPTFPPTELQEKLNERLEQHGFELLLEQKAQLIQKIKQLLIKVIHQTSEPFHLNYSAYLSNALSFDYSHLSRLFSSVEGITIEKYIIKLKVEKVKEYISYEELNMSEIADILGYSSVAHLSAQFKKETGMTPTEFKSLSSKSRTPIDLL